MASHNDTDVLFQNEDVCILKPESPRGVLIFTKSTSKNICSEGILSYNELRRRHPELGLQNRGRAHHDPKHNDTIFLRAPFNYDTTSFESSYGAPPEWFLSGSTRALAILRIDPSKTFVYSSETRAKGSYSDLMSSRRSMLSYFDVLRYNSTIRAESHKYKVCADIITMMKRIVPNTRECMYPMEDYLPIERMAEVVVHLPQIPPEWLVKCIESSEPEPAVVSVPAPAPPPARLDDAAAAGGPSGEFNPMWVLSSYGDCVIKCPGCGNTSGSALIISHRFNCENRNKTPNLEHKDEECAKLRSVNNGKSKGGSRRHPRLKRKKQTRRHKRR